MFVIYSIFYCHFVRCLYPWHTYIHANIHTYICIHINTGCLECDAVPTGKYLKRFQGRRWRLYGLLKHKETDIFLPDCTALYDRRLHLTVSAARHAFEILLLCILNSAQT